MELEDLENELEANLKEIVLVEIRNEVLKRMIYEETEKYHKYADYEF